MRRPYKQLTPLDRDLWASYTAQLKPLKGAAAVPVVLPATQPPADRAPAVVATPRPPATDWLAIGELPRRLDRSIWKTIRSNRHPVGRRLDLHGFTAQAAYHRFEQFMNLSAAHDIRLVEVITGRGAGETGGVLRRELPLWLNLPHLRPLVLAATYAHPSNTGAVWLLLRRRQH